MSDNIVKTKTSREAMFEGEIYTTIWKDMSLDGFIGEKCEVRGVKGRTFQVGGEFGGGSLYVEGSLDGEGWHAILDVDEPNVYPLKCDVRFIRPKLLQPSKETKLTLIFMQRRLA